MKVNKRFYCFESLRFIRLFLVIVSNLNNESGQIFFARKQAIDPQIFGVFKLQVLLANADSKTLISKGLFTV